MKALLFLLILILAGGLGVAAAVPPVDSVNSGFKFSTIVIDPGHGGKDNGAHGAYSVEKNIALAIGKRLKARLSDSMPELKVIMTRSDDTFIELNKRSEIANQHHANLFISVHCNSSPEGTAYRAHKMMGALVLVYGFHRKEEQEEAVRENASIYQEKDYKQKYGSDEGTDPVNTILLNAFMHKYREQSIHFGELLIHEFRDHDKRQIIGLKEQGVLVLAHSGMPAVLIETGFINNPIEEKYLNSENGQEEIVQSIIRAIRHYCNSINAQ